jgi:AraC-like DNA-binding protein
MSQTTRGWTGKLPRLSVSGIKLRKCLTRTGSGVIIDTSGAQYMVGSSFGTLFQYAVEYNNTFSLELGEDIKFTTLGVTYSDMCSMIGKDDAENILHALNLTEIPSSHIAVIPAHITSLLHSCMPDHLTGKIGVLFTQARVLDYLCALSDYVLSTVRSVGLNVSDKKLIQKMHHVLSESSGKVPALNELSQKYGKPGKVLNQGFKELYGMSIFKFISEQRLTKAHDALLLTDIPMKILAMNLGYSDVNHFIYAFGKKFGYTPGSLRKNKSLAKR